MIRIEKKINSIKYDEPVGRTDTQKKRNKNANQEDQN